MSVDRKYHKRDIRKGSYGEPSKIREELDELEDALEQNNRIMALMELSDIYGALEGVAISLGVSMKEVATMAECTRRAIQSSLEKP
jgi:hypothetical protein